METIKFLNLINLQALQEACKLVSGSNLIYNSDIRQWVLVTHDREEYKQDESLLLWTESRGYYLVYWEDFVQQESYMLFI